MIINDIEYAIRLWVEDENGEDIADKYFDNLHEMNVFIKDTWKEPEYSNANAFFSPVEVINGKPQESIIFEFEINPYIELDEDEIADYLYELQNSFDALAEFDKGCGPQTKFTPQKEADNYTAKRSHLSDITYICPHCYRELDDCHCKAYPYFLVQMDKLMIPIIRILNYKGYITTACCSGHADMSQGLTIYISFEKEHHFGSNIPIGSAYSKHGQTIQYSIGQEISKDEFLRFQSDCLEKITQWANQLPALNIE